MDENLVYAKTPNGDDAVRQSTRVVQRNLRMVLVLVDGKTSVAELGAKVGNPKLVESALQELEDGGFIAPVLQSPSVWEKGKKVAAEVKDAASQFSTFGPRSVRPADSANSAISEVSAFSDFGNPLMPPEFPRDEPAKPSMRERLAAAFRRPSQTDEDWDIPRRFRPVRIVQVMLGLLLLLCVGAIFYPYDNFRPDIEATLGRALQSPVRIGKVAVGLLPRPALILQDVAIGTKGEAHMDEVRIASLLSLLGGGRKQIPRIDVSGLAMPADAFGLIGGMGQDQARQGAAVTVGQVRLQRVTIRLGEVALRNLEGEISFKADGKLDKVRLQTDDRTLRIEAVPTAQGTALNIEGLAWKPVEGAPYVFESMQAKGLLQPGRLVLNDIDTTFLGGVLKGNWLLNWNNGMAMAGEANLDHMSARRVADAFAPRLKIDGELSGTLRMRGIGKDWQAMWANADASLEGDIVRGVLNGVDFGEAARRGVGRNTRGGATKFERLHGVIVVEPHRVTGHDVRLEAGLISADGRFVVDSERRVDGLFDVNISSSVSGVRMPIKVSGSVPDLVVSAAR